MNAISIPGPLSVAQLTTLARFDDLRDCKSLDLREIGRGGGDRKDKLANKACALNALQPRPLSNWNKRNSRQVSPPWAYAKHGIQAQFSHRSPVRKSLLEAAVC
jgi:hypothetical protein